MNTITQFIFVSMILACLLGSCSVRDAKLGNPVSEGVDPIFQNAFADIDRVPDSPLGYVNLAMVYMKESRKTGDFSLNDKAARAVAKALEIAPNDIPGRKLEASLHLAHHRFAEAVDAAKKLLTDAPNDSFVYGVLVDAYIEVGEYEKAVEAAQKMVDLKPGTASYSRVAQLRSLYGDHKGAVEMFTQAARAADPSDAETQNWCLVQLGDEYWKNGKYADAERVYDEALRNYPGYFLALVSKARVRASLGDYASAEKLLTDVQVDRPNANAILMLGDIYTLRGEIEKAEALYAQFDAIQAKLGTAADHRRLVLSWAAREKFVQALELASSEYAAEKGIHPADLLAWTLFKVGRAAEATTYIAEAMCLKTNDARTLYHAGMIAKENGDRREAKRLLTSALELNPAFDLVEAADARKALAEVR
jgi:tetratricopeptide (TPR) repeat protein